MKITFVNPRTGIYPPIGLCYLSAYLKEHLQGVSTELVETPPGTTVAKLVQKISATKPDVVGITTYTIVFADIIDLCKALKVASPELAIIVGGPHITSLPESLPRSADVGIIGEGENTLLDLCRLISSQRPLMPETLRDIEGICYHDVMSVAKTGRREYLTPLDRIPLPDLTILNMKWYTAYRTYFSMKGNSRGFVILTSRGCPFSCRFCQASAQWGRCRYHSASRVVTELERIRRDYPLVNAVNIIDDLFIGDRQRLREIVRLIRERNLHDGIVFNVNGHSNLVDEEVIRLLKSINVVQVAYGFESGSERVLNFLKKGSVTLERNRQVAELTNAYGIGVGGQFMIGSPGETEEDLRQTISFIRTTPMSHVHISATTPMPGTELWSICRSKGLISEDMDWRKLDFGNPDNPDLIYCNEDVLPRQQFEKLHDEARRAADRWNPIPSLISNLSYWQLYDCREFINRVLQGLNRLAGQMIRKLFNFFTRT